jgi:hypothetical protein
MSFMAVFDENGRCKYVLDGNTDSADVGNEPAVVYMEEAVDPNTVWYDHSSGKMLPRTPFRVSITNNKIERVPSGTVIYIGSDSAVVNEGSIEFEVDYAQTVVATMMHVRHLNKVVEVRCEVQG